MATIKIEAAQRIEAASDPFTRNRKLLDKVASKLGMKLTEPSKGKVAGESALVFKNLEIPVDYEKKLEKMGYGTTGIDGMDGGGNEITYQKEDYPCLVIFPKQKKIGVIADPSED